MIQFGSISGSFFNDYFNVFRITFGACVFVPFDWERDYGVTFPDDFPVRAQTLRFFVVVVDCMVDSHDFTHPKMAHFLVGASFGIDFE